MMIECANRTERADDMASCALAPRAWIGCGNMAKICAKCRAQWPGDTPPTEPTPILMAILPARKVNEPVAKAAPKKPAAPPPHEPTHCVHFGEFTIFAACCSGKRRINCTLYEDEQGMPMRNVTGAACRQCKSFEDRNQPEAVK